MAEFTDKDVPDLHGKNIVVTGGNSGIGLEAAVHFAKAGAHVVIACRNPAKAEQALEDLRRRSGSSDVEAMALDLSRLASVREFAEAYLARGVPLDVLVNNAGVMALPYGRTEDGFETQFATNHLGHFALSLRLLPALEKASAPRVVTVSSLTHARGSIPWSDLHGEKHYGPSKAYANSKLANLLFAYEFDRRCKQAGKRTISVACHPGMSATQITMSSMQQRGSVWLGKFLVWGNSLVAQPAEMGALPTLFAAVSPEVKGAEYVGPSRFFGTSGPPVIAESSNASRNVKDAARLFGLSEQMTGVYFA